MNRSGPGKPGAAAVLAVVLTIATALSAAPAVPVGDEADVPGRFDDLLGQFTGPRLTGLLEQALENQLRVERVMVATEIRENITYDKHDVADALALLRDLPAADMQDNLLGIAEAYALVDPVFAEIHRLHQAGQYPAAGDLAGVNLRPASRTCLAALQYYLRAESLHHQGRYGEAIEAYGHVMVRMPDRASLAAASALAAADVYRQIGCDYYAMRLQEYLLTHYAVTLGTERRRQISRTLAELRDLLGPEPPEGDEDLPGHDWVQVRSIGASTWDPTDADHAGETLAEFLDSLHRPSVAAGELSLPTQPGEVGLPDGEPMPPAGRAGATSVSRPSEVADPGQTESFEPTDPVTPRPAGGPVAPGESAR